MILAESLGQLHPAAQVTAIVMGGLILIVFLIMMYLEGR